MGVHVQQVYFLIGGNMNINRLTFIGCLSFLILGVTVVCTAASSPTVTIKGPFEQIVGILNAPQFKAPEKKPPSAIRYGKSPAPCLTPMH